MSAVFYEARNQSVAGMKAITEVVQNRARIRGKTVCAVISEKGQWSWFTRKKLLNVPNKKIDIDKVLRHEKVVGAEVEYFHSGKVKPKWVKRMVFVKKVGSHYFYKELN